MARKVIIDGDPGIDTAVAISIALFHPELEVVAVTAAAGNVSAEQASRNAHALVERLDPPRLPRVGAATPVDNAIAVEVHTLHGEDGLGGAGWAVSPLHHPHPSEKVLCEEIHAAADQVTIIALGPLTNLARAFHRDPSLAQSVGRIIMMGGCEVGSGDVTSAAEFNIYFDPDSAQDVFRSRTTKTLIPLEVTRQVAFSLDLLQKLPGEETWFGEFVRKMLSYSFRSHRSVLGMEGIVLHDAVALAAATNPEWFEFDEASVDIETGGVLTTGATVFDRRSVPVWRANMEVATKVDVEAVSDFIVRGLSQAGR